MKHSKPVTEEHFEAVINRCERPAVTDIVCPLCGINSTLQDLEKHLGLHMQEIALFALPHLGEGNNDGKSESNSETMGSSSESSGHHLSRKQNFEFDSDNKQSAEYQPITSPVAPEEIRCMMIDSELRYVQQMATWWE